MVEGRPGAPRRARSGRARLGRSVLAPTLITLAVIVASGATAYLAAPATADEVSVPLVPLAQFSSPDQPNISVVGVGRSSRPAETATIQILIGRQDAGFSVSEVTTAEGSTGSASGGMVPIAEGTPDPGSVQITPDELSPILDALETAGVARDDVTTIFSPLATEPFARPSGSARLDFERQRPTTEAMTQLVTGVSDAAASNGLVVQVVGARYDLADCVALEDEAQQAAITDARARAERLARRLNVTLGNVISASAPDTTGPIDDDGGCGDNRSGSYYSSGFGGLNVSLSPFDPAAPAEVTFTAALYVSYAIAKTGS